MMAEVVIRRHTTLAQYRGCEGLNLCICTVLPALERIIGMGGEGLILCIRSIQSIQYSAGWLPSW